MSRLNYVIDVNDLRSQQALDEVCKDAPSPQVVADMQGTLAKVLQSQMPPAPDPSAAGQTASTARASWGTQG